MDAIKLRQRIENLFDHGVPIDKIVKILNESILLHWYIGDGSFGNSIILCTNGFNDNEVNYLIQRLLTDLGINARYYNSQTGPQIKIFKRSEVKKFFKVLDQAGKRTQFCKKFFPWKFDNITKEDVIKSPEYIYLIKDYLLNRDKEMYEKVLEYIESY